MAIDLMRLVDRAEAVYFADYKRAVSDMVTYRATGDRDRYVAARDRLNETIIQSMRIASLIGAADQMRAAAGIIANDGPELLAARRDDLIAFAVQPLALAVVEFEEAVKDVRDRLPVVLKDPWDRTWQKVSAMYSDGRIIAFTRSAELSVTERAQKAIEKAMREGWGERVAGQQIVAEVDRARVETEAWSEGYARMAFRTNMNTATTAGRFRQAQEPVMQTVLPAMRFDSVGDVDTRPNHKAANGIVLRVSNPAWAYLAPPIGFSCRCAIVQMSLPHLRRIGRLDSAGNVIESNIPPGAHPDPGFRPTGRSDLFLGVG